MHLVLNSMWTVAFLVALVYLVHDKSTLWPFVALVSTSSFSKVEILNLLSESRNSPLILWFLFIFTSSAGVQKMRMEFLILHSHFFKMILVHLNAVVLGLLPIYQPNPYPNGQRSPEDASFGNSDKPWLDSTVSVLAPAALACSWTKLDLLQILLYQSLQMPPQLQFSEFRISCFRSKNL